MMIACVHAHTHTHTHTYTQTKELVPMMIASLKRKPGMWLGGKALVTGNFIIMKTTGVSSVHAVTVNK